MKTVVRDVMSRHPMSVRKTASFKEITARLRAYRVGAFPVLDDDGTVIGVVSEADLLAKEALDGKRYGMAGLITCIVHRKGFRKAAAVTAGDLMTSPPVTVSPEDTVERAARLMYSRGLKRLPVVDAAGARRDRQPYRRAGCVRPPGRGDSPGDHRPGDPSALGAELVLGPGPGRHRDPGRDPRDDFGRPRGPPPGPPCPGRGGRARPPRLPDPAHPSRSGPLLLVVPMPASRSPGRLPAQPGDGYLGQRGKACVK